MVSIPVCSLLLPSNLPNSGLYLKENGKYCELRVVHPGFMLVL